MKVEDYIKQHSELLMHPEKTVQLIERLRPYRIDCLNTLAFYLISFAENVDTSLENLFKQHKIDINNQNKVRKIINEIFKEAILIPKDISIAVKYDLYRAIQTDDSFLYLQKILEDNLGLEQHKFDIITNKALRRSIEEAIKNGSDTITLPQKSFADYLHHENKPALMKKLHELLDGKAKGRDIAKVLEALETKNYLLQQSYKVPEVIKEFNLQCSPQSINKQLHKNLITKEEKQQVIDLLP